MLSCCALSISRVFAFFPNRPLSLIFLHEGESMSSRVIKTIENCLMSYCLGFTQIHSPVDEEYSQKYK
jgi:hypothetical protein